MSDQGQGGASKTSISVTLPPADSNYEGRETYRTEPTKTKTADHVVASEAQNAPPHNTPVGLASSPSKATRNTPVRNKDKTRVQAARIIERAWLSYRDQQMFRLLKNSVCAAEHSLSYEILRKVSPKEAEFFKDPSCNIKVRFRFGGTEFPPEIFFKIYVHSDSGQIKYITGKKVLTADSEAAREALDLMGARKYYDIILQDSVHHQQHKITDEIDITTSKDYMQYLSIVDETPAYLGGKENYWRKLTLDSLPRTTIFYDLLEFAYARPGFITPRLRRELPALLTRPVTQDVQRQQIKIISQFRRPEIVNDGTPSPPKSRLHTEMMDSARSTGRRSKQARERSQRMRRAYQDEGKMSRDGPHREVTFMTDDADRELLTMRQNTFVDTEWDDDEAQQLYQWSQQLPMDELKTPRAPTMMSGPIS